MKHKNIVDGLRPWMRVGTWDTTHPLDQERFHRALKSVFDECGPNVAGDEFEAAMRELADDLCVKYQQAYLDERINHFAQLAENIGSYLYDVENQ